MIDICKKREHGFMRFMDGEDRWSFPDPEYEPALDALHACRYDVGGLTQSQAYLVCQMAEAYLHLATHPSGVGYVVEQLRAVRKALREWPR